MDPNQLPRIAPSKSDTNLWAGTRIAGQPFTREQETKAKAMQAKIAAIRARNQLPATYGVKGHSDRPRGAGDLAPTVYICPVIACTKDRKRLCVIAPNGSDVWVNWSHR